MNKFELGDRVQITVDSRAEIGAIRSYTYYLSGVNARIIELDNGIWVSEEEDRIMNLEPQDPIYIPQDEVDAAIRLAILNLTSLDPCQCGKDTHGFASHSNWCPKS